MRKDGHFEVPRRHPARPKERKKKKTERERDRGQGASEREREREAGKREDGKMRRQKERRCVKMCTCEGVKM